MQQAMAALRIGRTRLWQLTREGHLTAYQRGVNRKQRYYQRRDIERMVSAYQPLRPGANDGERKG